MIVFCARAYVRTRASCRPRQDVAHNFQCALLLARSRFQEIYVSFAESRSRYQYAGDSRNVRESWVVCFCSPPTSVAYEGRSRLCYEAYTKARSEVIWLTICYQLLMKSSKWSIYLTSRYLKHHRCWMYRGGTGTLRTGTTAQFFSLK